ncbi:DEAD/DEAH box helicase [Companilactobacillus farciminis]|uniref:DEAD/DEAH box helicase n=1 Tax=Companilactobacillus farciminis TaxID=1612 RepID=UPI00232AAA77|nr:DEAD/DEAH box helicase [Companilactobacillus farciminis]WCG36386.1 DEAD/DEAH box helicase family protein [Companilactobacillus farciminis]
MTFILRNYQNKLINDLKNSLVHGNHNVVVQSPAGSGKTVTMAAIAKGATDKQNNVLFIVHRREIVEQVKSTFKAYGVNMKLCYVGMVQTVTRRLEKLDKPQLILVDECHHALAKSYTRIFDYFKQANVVGFTATPIRLSGQGLSKVFDDLILGPQIDWLIDNNFLAPYEYYSVKLIDDKKLKKNSTGDFSSKSMDSASKNIIYGDVIKTYKRIAGNTKTIIYTHNVESSIKVAKEFNNAGFKALQVDGKTPKDKRKQVMDDFRNGKVTILVNAELYGEGVDVPDCQTVIMLRPTESLSLFIQQSMRCMRYRPNKTATIIDHVANYTRFGLPDTPRTWSLEGRPKKKSNGGGTAIRTCPHCFAVIPVAYSTCPICGYVIGVENKEMKVDKSVKVEKIGKDFHFKSDYEEVRYSQMKPQDATSYRDLQKIGKARGYKPGWAFFQAKNRGFVHQ